MSSDGRNYSQHPQNQHFHRGRGQPTNQQRGTTYRGRGQQHYRGSSWGQEYSNSGQRHTNSVRVNYQRANMNQTPERYRHQNHLPVNQRGASHHQRGRIGMYRGYYNKSRGGHQQSQSYDVSRYNQRGRSPYGHQRGRGGPHQVRRQHSNQSSGHHEELRSPQKVESHFQSSQDDFEQRVFEHLRSRSYFESQDCPTADGNLERFLDVSAVYLNKIKYWLQMLQNAFLDRVFMYRRTLFQELMPHLEKGDPAEPGLQRMNLLCMEMFVEQLVASFSRGNGASDITSVLTTSTDILANKNSLRHIQKTLLLIINDYQVMQADLPKVLLKEAVELLQVTRQKLVLLDGNFIQLYAKSKSEIINMLLADLLSTDATKQLEDQFSAIEDDWATIERALGPASKKTCFHSLASVIKQKIPVQSTILNLFSRQEMCRLSPESALWLLKAELGNTLEAASVIAMVLKELKEVNSRLIPAQQAYASYLEVANRHCHSCRLPLLEPELALVCANHETTKCIHVTCRGCAIEDICKRMKVENRTSKMDQKMWLRANSNLLYTCAHCRNACDEGAACKPFPEPVLGYELVGSMYIGKETRTGFLGENIAAGSMLGVFKSQGRMAEVAEHINSVTDSIQNSKGSQLAGVLALVMEEMITSGKNPMMVPLFGRMTPRREEVSRLMEHHVKTIDSLYDWVDYGQVEVLFARERALDDAPMGSEEAGYHEIKVELDQNEQAKNLESGTERSPLVYVHPERSIGMSKPRVEVSGPSTKQQNCDDHQDFAVPEERLLPSGLQARKPESEIVDKHSSLPVAELPQKVDFEKEEEEIFVGLHRKRRRLDEKEDIEIKLDEDISSKYAPQGKMQETETRPHVPAPEGEPENKQESQSEAQDLKVTTQNQPIDPSSVEIFGQIKPESPQKESGDMGDSCQPPQSQKEHDHMLSLPLNDDLAAKCQKYRHIVATDPESLVKKTMIVFRPAFNCWQKADILSYKEGENPQTEKPCDISLETKQFLEKVMQIDEVRVFRIQLQQSGARVTEDEDLAKACFYLMDDDDEPKQGDGRPPIKIDDIEPQQADLLKDDTKVVEASQEEPQRIKTRVSQRPRKPKKDMNFPRVEVRSERPQRSLKARMAAQVTQMFKVEVQDRTSEVVQLDHGEPQFNKPLPVQATETKQPEKPVERKRMMKDRLKREAAKKESERKKAIEPSGLGAEKRSSLEFDQIAKDQFKIYNQFAQVDDKDQPKSLRIELKTSPKTLRKSLEKTVQHRTKSTRRNIVVIPPKDEQKAAKGKQTSESLVPNNEMVQPKVTSKNDQDSSRGVPQVKDEPMSPAGQIEVAKWTKDMRTVSIPGAKQLGTDGEGRAGHDVFFREMPDFESQSDGSQEKSRRKQEAENAQESQRKLEEEAQLALLHTQGPYDVLGQGQHSLYQLEGGWQYQAHVQFVREQLKQLLLIIYHELPAVLKQHRAILASEDGPMKPMLVAQSLSCLNYHLGLLGVQTVVNEETPIDALQQYVTHESLYQLEQFQAKCLLSGVSPQLLQQIYVEIINETQFWGYANMPNLQQAPLMAAQLQSGLPQVRPLTSLIEDDLQQSIRFASNNDEKVHANLDSLPGAESALKQQYLFSLGSAPKAIEVQQVERAQNSMEARVNNLRVKDYGESPQQKSEAAQQPPQIEQNSGIAQFNSADLDALENELELGSEQSKALRQLTQLGFNNYKDLAEAIRLEQFPFLKSKRSDNHNAGSGLILPQRATDSRVALEQLDYDVMVVQKAYNAVKAESLLADREQRRFDKTFQSINGQGRGAIKEIILAKVHNELIADGVTSEKLLSSDDRDEDPTYINVLERGIQLIDYKEGGQEPISWTSDAPIRGILAAFESREEIDVRSAMQSYIAEKIRRGNYRKCLCDACNVRKIPMLIRRDIDLSQHMGLAQQEELAANRQVDLIDQRAFRDKHQELFAAVVSHKHAEILCELKTVEDYEEQQQVRQYYRWLLCRQDNFGLESDEQRRIAEDKPPYGNWLFEKVLAVTVDEMEPADKSETAHGPINVDKMIDDSNWRSQQIDENTRLPPLMDCDISELRFSRIHDSIKQLVRGTEQENQLLQTVGEFKEHLRLRERFNQEIESLSKIQRQLQALKHDRMKQWVRQERTFQSSTEIAQLKQQIEAIERNQKGLRSQNQQSVELAAAGCFVDPHGQGIEPAMHAVQNQASHVSQMDFGHLMVSNNQFSGLMAVDYSSQVTASKARRTPSSRIRLRKIFEVVTPEDQEKQSTVRPFFVPTEIKDDDLAVSDNYSAVLQRLHVDLDDTPKRIFEVERPARLIQDNLLTEAEERAAEAEMLVCLDQVAQIISLTAISDALHSLGALNEDQK